MDDEGSDPVGGGATGLYEYCAGNPASLLDVSGRNAYAIGGGVAVVVIGGVALYVYWDAMLGPTSAAESTKLPGMTNGPQDAVRHCIGACVATADFGETVEGWLEDLNGDDNSTPDGHMDLMNNGVGRACGAGIPSGNSLEDCKKACVDKYNSGQLETLPKSKWRH